MREEWKVGEGVGPACKSCKSGILCVFILIFSFVAQTYDESHSVMSEHDRLTFEPVTRYCAS